MDNSVKNSNSSKLILLLFAVVLAFRSVVSYDVRCYRPHWDHNVIILVHPEDCRKFYKCDQNFKLIEKSCPPTLEFDPVLKICDWPKGYCAPNTMKPVDSVMVCGKH